MDVRNCKKCGRLFNYVSGLPICQVCREEIEKKFVEVKEYIREHKISGVTEVAEACDVTIKQIQQWLRDDRLMLADDSPLGIACERCGKTIKGGKFCAACSNEMANSFKSVMGTLAPAPAKQETSSRAKMRYLDN